MTMKTKPNLANRRRHHRPRSVILRAGTHLALCLAALLLTVASAQANNLTISNVSLTGQDTGSDFILVQFDITWDNSWRVTSAGPDTPTNWDAVWVFVKYRLAGGEWRHATLNTSGHTPPSGSMIDTPTDGKGVFLYRSSDGTGSVVFTSVQLRWNYGVDGLADGEPDLEVQVLGIEMVYVPQGAFAAGSGGTEAGAFTLTTINTADATVMPSGTGSLGGEAGGYPTGQTAPANASWPNGFAAFYIQKYEISQGQYAAFLSLLPITSTSTRYPNTALNRHTITGSYPTFVAGVSDRACNWLSWADGAAYADWAGLRPMTELEYEKASRGTRLPVANEYAWGTTSIHASAYTLTNDGQPDATVNEGSGTGNASYGTTDGLLNGPLRVGIFAASFALPTRRESGGTFYGVMEMSGNLWERAVTIANATGLAFTGTHGDGGLTANGDADAVLWPGTDATGAGFRGASWLEDSSDLRISDRSFAAFTATDRGLTYGFRAVRSAL